MTTLEIIFTVAFWIILGVWVCYKSKWFNGDYEQVEICIATILFSPISFLIAFIENFLIKKW